MNKKYCINCNNVLTGKQKKFCSKKCKNTYYNKNYKAITTREKGRVVKYYLVCLKGKKCEICGYNKNLAALQFHHIDSTTKSFAIDQRACANRALKTLIKETRACTLLCANCHSEKHNIDLYLNKNSDFNSKELLKKWVNSGKAKL